VRIAILIALILLAAGPLRALDIAQEADEHSDIDVSVSLDPGEQSGKAQGVVRIHAPRETVWALITSCVEAANMIPGLQSCTVLDTAPDRSWQRIRHVMNYSWYLPTLTYELRASYRPPGHVAIERVSGDLRVLRGSWDLQSDGAYTIARYSVELATGFWVPHWMVRSALRHDLPKMLRALRSHAEAIQGGHS
jgi:hypothetical protein